MTSLLRRLERLEAAEAIGPFDLGKFFADLLRKPGEEAAAIDPCIIPVGDPKAAAEALSRWFRSLGLGDRP